MIERNHPVRVVCRLFPSFVILLWSAWPPVVAGQPIVMSEPLRSQTIDRVMASDEFKQLLQGESVRALRVFIDEAKREDEKARAPEAIVTFVSYASGTGVQARVDVSNGKVVEVVRLAGRPQSSEEERAEARKLILKDPAIRAALDSGGYIEGGFVVDAPEGSRKPGRYLEFHVVERKRPKFIQEVIVDLSVGGIALVRSEDASLQR